ncbi:MAG: hypothetical protein WD847_04550 [Pirellulales bacterium]
MDRKGGRLQLSNQQVRILLTIHAAAQADPPRRCERSELHAAVFGHSTRRRGGAAQPAGLKLSASQRAVLSRAVRRLGEQGLVEDGGLALTAAGAELVEEMTAWHGWGFYVGDHPVR